jgi:hypothetical protein
VCVCVLNFQAHVILRSWCCVLYVYRHLTTHTTNIRSHYVIRAWMLHRSSAFGIPFFDPVREGGGQEEDGKTITSLTKYLVRLSTRRLAETLRRDGDTLFIWDPRRSYTVETCPKELEGVPPGIESKKKVHPKWETHAGRVCIHYTMSSVIGMLSKWLLYLGPRKNRTECFSLIFKTAIFSSREILK